MEHYRYRKITPEILKNMQNLKKENISNDKIAKMFNIAGSTVSYWLSEKQKKNAIKRAKKFYKEKMTKEEKSLSNKKRYNYKKDYLKERYNNDEEFRERYKKYVSDSFKRRSKIWVEKGLCSTCGRERENKRFKQCERCRKKKWNTLTP